MKSLDLKIDYTKSTLRFFELFVFSVARSLITPPLIIYSFGECTVCAGLTLSADAGVAFFAVLTIDDRSVFYARTGFDGGGKGGDIAEGYVRIVLHQSSAELDVITEEVWLSVDPVLSLTLGQVAGAEHYRAAVKSGLIHDIPAADTVGAVAGINERIMAKLVADGVDRYLGAGGHVGPKIQIPGRCKISAAVDLDLVIENTTDDVKHL